MLGRKLPLSNTKNLPMFTLAPLTDPNNKVVISSKHVQDQLGRDSPGVGAYQYDFDQLSKSVLNRGKGGDKFSFGSSAKFFEHSSVTKLNMEK
jgi:hypothetical protein